MPFWTVYLFKVNTRKLKDCVIVISKMVIQYTYYYDPKIKINFLFQGIFYLIFQFYCFLFSECEHCDGFEHGHTCSDSGDCYENQCHCDTMFSGHACQLGRKCFFYFYFLGLTWFWSYNIKTRKIQWMWDFLLLYDRSEGLYFVEHTKRDSTLVCLMYFLSICHFFF